MRRFSSLISIVALASFAYPQLGTLLYVSQSTSGISGQNSIEASISQDGRLVAFSSDNNNLVPGDMNHFSDVFVRDCLAQLTWKASRSSLGEPGNSVSEGPSISSDGNYVSYTSYADNLVPGDFNQFPDIFVRSLLEETTIRVSVGMGGTDPNGASESSSISGDGRLIAFASVANNLVPGDTNSLSDVFVFDRLTNQTTRLSVGVGGTEANGNSNQPSISANGRYVAFRSRATNLVPSDTNGIADVFVFDLLLGTLSRESVSSSGGEAFHWDCNNPKISETGRWIVFDSKSSTLVSMDFNNASDVFVRDRELGITSIGSRGPGGVLSSSDSSQPDISDDGRFITFISRGDNLHPQGYNGWWQVYIHDTLSLRTTLASVDTNGSMAFGFSYRPAISSDGRYVAFDSRGNLLPNITGGVYAMHYSDIALPTMYSVVRGIEEVGGITAVLHSDDQHLVLRPGIVFSSSESPVTVAATSNSPTSAVNVLTLSIESQATAANVAQRIDLYDFASEEYLQVDERQSTTTDQVTTIVVTDKPSRFIGGSGEIRARVRYKLSGPVFAFPWRVRIDQIAWRVQ